MVKDFVKVDALTGVQNIQDMACKKGYDYFPVVEDGKIIGVITCKDLMRSHANRIAADAMSDRFICVSSDTVIWKAEEMLKDGSIDVLFVEDKNKLAGIVAQPLLDAVLGKHTDLLTGLYKSDYIYYNASELIKSGKEISLIFLDVDNFGQIDKEYGHIKGDAILKEISMLLKHNISKSAYLCRFGGDEFLILIPCHIKRCETSARKLLGIITSHKFYNGIPVTVSAGIAGGRRYSKSKRMQNEYTTVENLINIASLASTKAKKDNNNITVVNDSGIDEIA